MRFKLLKDELIENLKSLHYVELNYLLDEDARFVAGPIIDNIKRNLKVNLVGVKATNPEEFAVIFSMLRDKSWEIFRVVYLKDNVVVASDAYTCKHPGFSCISRNYRKIHNFDDEQDDNRMFMEVTWRMEKYHADGYIILHNHPHNNSEPSLNDLWVAKKFLSTVPGFYYSLVLGDGNYIIIDSNLSIETIDYSPELKNELKQCGILGTTLNNRNDFANISKKYLCSNDVSCIFYLSANNEVLAVQEIDNSDFNNKEIKNWFKNMQSKLGSFNIYVVTKNKDVFNNFEIVHYGYIRDMFFIDVDNSIISQKNYSAQPVSDIPPYKKYKF